MCLITKDTIILGIDPGTARLGYGVIVQRGNLLATMACKAAVKDGDVLDWPEMKQLVLDLMATPNYQTCPHGRPTIITITKPDLAKSFKRT